MSYAGTYGPDETCKHDNYWRNCRACIIEEQEARGIRDEKGILHSDNGFGWCIGHLIGQGDGRSNLLVRHCPVLNTPEQVKANLRADLEVQLERARHQLVRAGEKYNKAKQKVETLVWTLNSEYNEIR